MRKIFFVMVVFGLMFTACHRHNHDHNHAHEGHVHTDHDEAHDHSHCDGDHDHSGHEEDGATHEDAIHFSSVQQEKIAFATDFPRVEPFGQVIKSTAQVQRSQGDEAIISARTSGIVLFSGKMLLEGQAVTSSQHLLTISGAGLADNNSQVRFAEAQNTYQKAESDYKRAQELVKEKIISEKDFSQIKADYETARTVYDNLSRNFGKEGQKVLTPFQGYLKQVFVENGQYVEAGQALVAVAQNKTLLLKADVRPKQAAILPFLTSATLRGADKVVYSLEDLNGKILSYGKSLNDDLLIPINLQIDNKAGFIPGSFVEVFLKTRSEEPVMTVPCAALTEELGNYFVYVQLTPDTFEKREVNIGITDGIRTEILSGLDRDERIVTEGAISVRLAQAAGALDPHAGHVH